MIVVTVTAILLSSPEGAIAEFNSILKPKTFGASRGIRKKIVRSQRNNNGIQIQP